MNAPSNDNGDAAPTFDSDLALRFLEALGRDAARYDYAQAVAAQGGNDDEAERRAA